MSARFRLVCLLLVGAWLGGGLPAHAQRKARKKPAASAPPPRRALTRADSLVLKARTLVAQHHEAQALALCRQALRDNPLQYEALWRASVLHSHIGARYSDETRQQQAFDDARALAARALEIHPDFATANYAMALAVANGGTLAPLRGRLNGRLEEKFYLDAALLDEPRHAGALQLLARWHFKVANYTVFETAASKLLLGRIPHGASNKAAEHTIRLAIEVNPQQIEYYYDLARMCQLRGRREAAIQALLAGQDVTLITTEDLAVSRQMEQLLKQLQRRRRMNHPQLEAR